MSRYQLVVVAAIFSLLMSCGEASPKFITSGSSNFGFINYFIEPITDSVIAVVNTAPGTVGTEVSNIADIRSNAITSQSDFNSITQQADTVKSTIDASYCNFYATAFDEKTTTNKLYKDPSSHLAIIAPLVAERSYLELMRNYCYSNKAFYLDDTRVTDESNSKYGKVRWYKNQSTNLGSSKNFDFLISQSKKDNTTKILTVFKEDQAATVTDRLYGKMYFTQQLPSKDRQFNLIRYFVDDGSKTEAIPMRFRQEGYAMSTTTDGENQVHHIATFILNYVKNSTSSADEPNGLIIHSNQFVIHSNWGAKLVKASYCVYTGPDDTRDKAIVTTNKATYNCDTVLGSDVSADINNSDKTGDAVEAGYYDAHGGLLKQDENSYSTSEEKAIQALDKSVNLRLLNTLSDQISPPLILGKAITLGTLNEQFDTTSAQSHLKFEQ